jgi:hypothetical protein
MGIGDGATPELRAIGPFHSGARTVGVKESVARAHGACENNG